MKNGIFIKLNKNKNMEYCVKSKVTNFRIKMFYFILVLMCFIKISRQNKIIIVGKGECLLNINPTILSSVDSKCAPTDSKLKCNLGLSESSIEFPINTNANVVSAHNMFKDCSSLTNIDLSNFVSTSLNETDGMFENCISLTTIKFSNFDVSNVLNMSHMFYNCSLLQSIDFNDFANTVQNLLIDMSFMFFNCSSLAILDLGFSSTSKLKNMSNMFELCTNLKELTFSLNFDTSSVENMENMLSNCINLNSVDLSKFEFGSVTSMNGMFRNCAKLKTIRFPQSATNSLINMGSMFQSCSSLDTIDLSTFDTSSVLFMNDLFHDCTSLKNIMMSNFMTENVIKMESMFENCKSLINIDLNNFYTPSVRQMNNLFSGCTAAMSIDISKFDTFQVTNFANIFYNCYSLQSISLLHFVTNMASDMSQMFFNCSKLEVLNLSNFNTERVIKMNSMFQGCSSLSTLILSNFQNTQVMDMSHIFEGCSALKSLNLNSFYTISVKNMNSIFSGCKSLTYLNLENFSTNNVINMNSMFSGCSSLTSIKMTTFNTINVEDMGNLFYECSSLSSIILSDFKTVNTVNIEGMFYNCKSLKTLNLNSFDTSKINSMRSLFHGCAFIEVLDLKHFKTNNVRHMEDLFNGCSSLIRLDISNFDISKILSMGYMFYGCKSLTSLILPDFKKLEVLNTSYTFAGCSSLTSMDLTELDTHAVISMDYMFSGCTFLKHLILSKWNTKNVESMNYMFSGCASLTSLNLYDFITPKLNSIKGMFYGCSSLSYIDLTWLNTTLVTSTAYMFYKAKSLTSIQFQIYEQSDSINSTIQNSYFNTPSLENMRYMFAYCTYLEKVDLSHFNTEKVTDMSYMFAECSTITSVNLSSFDTSKVTNMESMFYRCLNLSYINMINASDSNIIINNFLTDSLYNMVFCINIEKATKINDIKNSKGDCAIIDCEVDYITRRKRLIVDDSLTFRCVDNCTQAKKFEYLYKCYNEKCPNGTYHKENDFECQPDSTRPPPCTLQRIILDNCTFEELEGQKYQEDTTEIKILFINNLKKELTDKNVNFVIGDYVLKYGMVNKNLFNINFQFSTLSDKNIYNNLSYINIQDCENYLKRKQNIDENKELLFFKVEYYTDEFQIPIIEYSAFDIEDRVELKFNVCEGMKFVYSIPVDINENLEYKFNPDSDYNNEICFQFTTENKTDIILYDRRKEFNDQNSSLCENNCKYLSYYNKRVECECPIKSEFNQFLLDESKKDNIIFKFTNNQMQTFNLGILKCIKMLFSKNAIKNNYSSIFFIVLLVGNTAAALFFCITGYKTLYAQVQALSENMSKKKDGKKFKSNKIKKGKENIITTGHNPPPKLKADNNDLISDGSGKNKLENSGQIDSKINAPDSIIDSKNSLNKKNLSILDRLNENEFVGLKTDMEFNMISYEEAIKTDKRGCLDFYISFLKTRHLLVCIFITDYNSIIVKICFLFFVFGICQGVNAFFFNDKAIQKIYYENGNYSMSAGITDHIMSIIISTVVASIIKSLMFLLTLTDVAILEIKENNDAPKEEKINRALIKVTSKSTLFFIINFAASTLLWIYVGTFCIIFKNTQQFLLVNSAVSLCGVCVLPLLYYLIPAVLRMMAINGKNSECLYKFSQFFELI